MYGSWYAGSQASSWIFWWAFARLCRLTSTPHGLVGASVGGYGRWAGPPVECAGASFPGGRDGRGRRGPRRLREAGGTEPPTSSASCCDSTTSAGCTWSQYETDANPFVPR